MLRTFHKTVSPHRVKDRIEQASLLAQIRLFSRRTFLNATNIADTGNEYESGYVILYINCCMWSIYCCMWYVNCCMLHVVYTGICFASCGRHFSHSFFHSFVPATGLSEREAKKIQVYACQHFHLCQVFEFGGNKIQTSTRWHTKMHLPKFTIHVPSLHAYTHTQT